jgi:hypothetical protein
MKNTLAENMLRFGVKNLKESNVKRIEESLLTEASVDLSKDPRLPKTFAAIKAQIDKGIKMPKALMGQYLIMFTQPQNFDAMQVQGKVLAFQSMPFPGVGNLPSLPDYTVGFGGNFSWRLTDPVPYMIENDLTIPSFDRAIKPAAIANIINQSMASIDIKTLQAMYAAHPNKAKYDAAIAAFKANPNSSQVLAALTGNAKAFYAV